jgi:AcrR family transcriptional regulator
MARGLARDHDEKREALRKGAAQHFAAHGFDRASMTGVARSLGVSKALIYHYWPSKEDLLFDIFDAHFADLLDATDGATDLTGMIGALLAAYEHADPEHKLQLDALKLLPPDRQAPLMAAQRALVARMSDAVAREAPHLTADELRASTMTVFGIVNWVYMWHRPGKGMSRTDYARFAAGFVRGGLAAL